MKDLPQGYCHGDLHCGNFLKAANGQIYLLDFDTSCRGFPLYDIALLCNQTHYFEFDKNGLSQSKALLQQFLPGYTRFNSLTTQEIEAFPDFIGIYHFALQAVMIELFGLDCVDNIFFDKQLDWLYQWRELCARV